MDGFWDGIFCEVLDPVEEHVFFSGECICLLE